MRALAACIVVVVALFVPAVSVPAALASPGVSAHGGDPGPDDFSFSPPASPASVDDPEPVTGSGFSFPPVLLVMVGVGLVGVAAWGFVTVARRQ